VTALEGLPLTSQVQSIGLGKRRGRNVNQHAHIVGIASGRRRLEPRVVAGDVVR
jgi:hypothetical protein